MGLMKKRASRWIAFKLHRLADTLKRVGFLICEWGKHGQMDCPVCGRTCHMDNIDSDQGMCFDCAPTPVELNCLPDAYIIEFGKSYLIQGANRRALVELERMIGSLTGAKYWRDTLEPANIKQFREVVASLREMDMDVQLHR